MTKCFQPRVDACKNNVEERKVLDRWAELFEDLLNADDEVDENLFF